VREQQRDTATAAAAAAAPPPAPALGSEASEDMSQILEVVEEGGPLRDGAAPGPSRVLAPDEHRATLEKTTTGDDTDGEGSIGAVETPRWAGRRRRSWSGPRRGDGEDAAGKARGLLLLLLAGAAGAHTPEDEDDGGRSRQSTPTGREYRAKRRRISSADADADEPVPVPAPVGTQQQPTRRDSFTFARLGKSGRHGREMQVDLIEPTLKAPGITRLKLIWDEPLSSFAFNLNLRRYITA